MKQCDPRWANKKLGNSNLCKIGCTVTALAMLAGTTPDKIVDEASFTPDGRIYWQTLKSLNFIWRGYKYENDKVLKAIKDYGGCLVEVSMPQAPGSKHWVLAIGNGKIIDPLDGKKKAFSTYKPTGYAILETKQADMSDTIQIKKSTFEKLVGKSSKYDEFVKMGYDQPKKIEEDIKNLKKELKNLKKELKNKDKEIKSLERSNSGLQGEITKKKKVVEKLEKQIKNLQEQLINQPVADLSNKVVELVGIYLLPTAALTYLSIYLTRVDPEISIAIAPTINLIIYILKQQAEKLMLKLGVARSKKTDE